MQYSVQLPKTSPDSVQAQTTGGHKAQLLQHQTVGFDTDRKDDHGHIGGQKGQPAELRYRGVGGQQEGAHQAQDRAGPLKTFCRTWHLIFPIFVDELCRRIDFEYYPHVINFLHSPGLF